MLQKLTTTHMALIGIGVLILGFVIGKYWDTWFPSDAEGGEFKIGGRDCPTRGGIPCCRPASWRFNNSTNKYECTGGAN